MKLTITFLLLSLYLSPKAFSQQTSSKSVAERLIKQSIKAMGSRWDSVKSVSFDGYGYQNEIDESERSEGPFIPIQIQRSIIKDLVHGNFQAEETNQAYTFSGKSTYLFNGEAITTKTGKVLQSARSGKELRDELNLAPELILKKALASPDLKFLKDTVFQKAQHSILFFKDNGYPVRFFLNRETGLLSAIEVTKPLNDNFANIWGDVKKTVIYSFWMLLDKGLHYPLQQDVYINNWYKESFLVNSWKVNPEIHADSLTIPDSIKQEGKMMENSERQGFIKRIAAGGKEISPGIWFLPGICNSTLIEQADGIVVIEAPYSSFYGGLIINRVNTLFPGKKIKALISTSDAWLHIGGIRAFAALPGIKIYHPARNRPIIEKLLKAQYLTEPDAFAKILKPSYSLAGITDTLALGMGKNRLVMYAYKTETGDRQMMVYFPQYKMVYTSDLYQGSDGKRKYWDPQIVWEVYHSIKGRKIEVQQFYSTHSRGLLAFKDFEKDVIADMQ